MCIWEANIKMNPNRTRNGAVDWIHLAQDITTIFYACSFHSSKIEIRVWDSCKRCVLLCAFMILDSQVPCRAALPCRWKQQVPLKLS
jgi:hypothetical protein